MKQDKLTAEDLGLVNDLVRQYPEFLEMVHVVKLVNSKLKYPIETFDDIAEALGSETSITFRGRRQLLGDIRDYVPAYYFPISSERDLVAKLRDLAKGSPVGSQTAQACRQGGIEVGARMERLPEGVKRPDLTREDIARIVATHKPVGGIIPLTFRSGKRVE
jgi:hypothetical protein